MAGETAERTATIGASAADVWAVVGDVTRMPEWSEELESVELLSGDGRSVGSRFRGNNVSGSRRWSMTCVVDRYADGQLLEFHTVDDKGQPRTRWWYRLSSGDGDGDGGGGGGTVVAEGFERLAKLGRIRALAERKLIGDRAEYNAKNIDESLRRLASLFDAR